MMMSKSKLFHVAPESWLGLRLDSGRQEVVSPKKALACECKPNKGDTVADVLKASLELEAAFIDKLPEVGFALRADRIEAKRAEECKEQTSPSVDVCIRAGAALMLVECKYKAMPETSIVKSVDSFNFSVARKFESSLSFFRTEGASSFSSDRIVIFNAASKDKVISMFRRLQLELNDKSLSQYKIMDTADFWMQYKAEILNGLGEFCMR